MIYKFPQKIFFRSLHYLSLQDMHFLEVLFRIASRKEIAEEKLLKWVWMIGMEVALRLQAIELLSPDLQRGVRQGLIQRNLLQL